MAPSNHASPPEAPLNTNILVKLKPPPVLGDSLKSVPQPLPLLQVASGRQYQSPRKKFPLVSSANPPEGWLPLAPSRPLNVYATLNFQFPDSGSEFVDDLAATAFRAREGSAVEGFTEKIARAVNKVSPLLGMPPSRPSLKL